MRDSPPSRSALGTVLRRTVKVTVAAVLAVLLVPPAAAGTVVATYLLMPLPASLPPQKPLPVVRPSVVYAADGSVIGEFREVESRVPIPSEQIPDTMRRAIIAVEDHEFFRHEGIAWRGIARALWKDLNAGRFEQGGSTITQQLVKNRFTSGDRTLARKLREAYLSVQLERVLDKEEILTRYLNTVYFGDSLFGVEAAARSYFHKPAKDLTLSEAALLAGVVPAPSLYSPRRNPDAAEHKRQVVLDALERHGLATPEEVAAARAEPPAVHPPPAIDTRYPYFLDYVRWYLFEVKRYEPELIYGGGLRIDTTLDPKLQDHAARVVASTLDAPDDPAASLVSLEPRTGFVRAIIGGRDWNRSQVNLALGHVGGGAGRQAGSAFKPFVLARALDAGMTPDRVYPAPETVQPPGFDQPVKNYGGAAYGEADLVTATEKSINTVYVQLIADVGIKQTAELAKRLGITSIDLSKPVYGSIALGSQEVSPLDMASAYGVFATGGTRAEPTPVVRITGPDGTLEDNENRNRLESVLEQGVADAVNHILSGVITNGTGTRADIGRPAAGKTGTSQNYENAWFVGYTPELSTSVWVGHPEGNIPMHGVQGVRAVAGGTIPARIWHDFMMVALEDRPPTAFNAPVPVVTEAERRMREQRGGVDAGERPPQPGLPPVEGPYFTAPPLPQATQPTAPPPPSPPPPEVEEPEDSADDGDESDGSDGSDGSDDSDDSDGSDDSDDSDDSDGSDGSDESDDSDESDEPDADGGPATSSSSPPPAGPPAGDESGSTGNDGPGGEEADGNGADEADGSTAPGGDDADSGGEGAGESGSGAEGESGDDTDSLPAPFTPLS